MYMYDKVAVGLKSACIWSWCSELFLLILIMLIILASYESHAIKYKIIIIKLMCKSSMTMLGFKGIKNCGILEKGHIL